MRSKEEEVEEEARQLSECQRWGGGAVGRAVGGPAAQSKHPASLQTRDAFTELWPRAIGFTAGHWPSKARRHHRLARKREGMGECSSSGQSRGCPHGEYGSDAPD